MVSVQEVAKDLLFDKALKKAKGEKVKDDVSKIKKTIKRKQSSKAKSQREWYVSTTNTHCNVTHLLTQSINSIIIAQEGTNHLAQGKTRGQAAPPRKSIVARTRPRYGTKLILSLSLRAASLSLTNAIRDALYAAECQE